MSNASVSWWVCLVTRTVEVSVAAATLSAARVALALAARVALAGPAALAVAVVLEYLQQST
jgi:hypothetical protein